MGWTLNELGLAYSGLGSFNEAIDCYQQALAIRREVGDRYGEAVTLNNLGETLQGTNEGEAAQACWRQALAILEELGAPEVEEVRSRLNVHVLPSCGLRSPAEARAALAGGSEVRPNLLHQCQSANGQPCPHLNFFGSPAVSVGR